MCPEPVPFIQRRVGATTFFKNRPYLTSSAMSLLQTVQLQPEASNRRLAVLTGLGVTKDNDNDGVLPTYLSYLQAMDLIAPGTREGIRFILTETGSTLLECDRLASGRGTVALMAMLLCEPFKGAHIFDWTVRGMLSHLRSFSIDDLRQEVEKLAAQERLGPTHAANFDVVTRAFTGTAAFGPITPWTSPRKDEYVPQPPLELEPFIFWPAAFMFVRCWRGAFPNTYEATLRDVRREVLVLPRGVLGVRGRVEEQFIDGLQREGIISTTAVTMERVTIEARDVDLPSMLRQAFSS